MNNFLKFLGFCDGLEMGDNTKAAAIRYFLLCGRIQIRNYNSYPDPTLSFGSYFRWSYSPVFGTRSSCKKLCKISG